MLTVLKRIWSALRSVFRRNKNATVRKGTFVYELEEPLVSEFNRILEHAKDEEMKRKKAEKNYLIGNLNRYERMLNQRLKVAKKVQNLAMYHPRERTRKKNLNRLGREIARMIPLRSKTVYYTIAVHAKELEENVPLRQDPKSDVFDMPKLREADHMGENKDR